MQSSSPNKEPENKTKRRLIWGACLMVGLSVVLFIGAASYIVYDVFIYEPPQEPIVITPLTDEELELADLVYSGEQQTVGGSGESIELMLFETNRHFELQTLFGDRSGQPTVRSGRWHSEGNQLWLEIVELDGEPIAQANLQFQIADNALVGMDYDRAWFDYDVFVLARSGEIVPDSAE